MPSPTHVIVANFTIVVVGKSLHAQILNLAKFYSITYCFVTKKIGIFRVRFISFPLVKFQRFAGPLNIFVSLLVPVNKKILRTKFEMEEENTK